MTRPSNRLRNVFLALCALGALIGGGWWAAQRYLGINNYRALIIERIQDATGMPCAIDSMALHFLPQPQVLLSGLHIGHDGLKIDIKGITALVDAAALLRGTIVLPSVTVDGLAATLPEDWSGYEAKAAANIPSGDAGEAQPFTVGMIDIPQWSIHRGGALVGQGAVKIVEPLGANATFTCDAQLPGLSPQASVMVEGAITRAAGAFSLAGKAALKHADLAQAAGRAELASAVLNAELTFEGASPDDIAFTLDGDISASGAAEVAGKVSGKAWWRTGEFTANDFTWDSPGLHLVADLSRKPGGELAANVREAEAEKDGLALLLGLASTKDARLDARKGAKVTVKDLLVGRAADGEFRWAKGTASVQGIDVKGAKGAVLEDLSAKLRLEEGTLIFDDATASGLRAAGRITPAAKGGVKFDIAASGTLSNPLISGALPSAITQGAKGSLNIKRATGIWTGAAGLPAGLAVEGSLENGELHLKTDRFNDTIRELTLNFTTDGRTVSAKASASAETMGALKFEGTLDTATRATDGTVSFSLNRLAAGFVPFEGGAEALTAMLGAYEGADYAVSFRAPESTAKPGRFTLESKATPPAKVDAVLLTDKALGVTTGAITASFQVPFAPAAAALPIEANGGGDAMVRFERSAEGRFTGSADLSGASLTVDPYLNKRAGAAVRLDIEGAAGDTWILERITLDLLGQPIALVPKGDGFAAEDLQIDLARLAPLFPEGSEAAGSVGGSIGTSPTAANLRLTGVRVKTPSGIAIDEINGAFAYAPGALRVDGLHVVAYGSDFTLDGAMKDKQWEGSLRGPRADLNTLAALRALGGGPEAGGGAAAPGTSGAVNASLDEVIFRKAVINNFQAQIRFSAEEFAVDQISCAPYGGTATGAVVVRTPGGAREGTATTKINFKDVDLKLLDDLSASEPRGMYGPASGTVDLGFPYGPEAKPYMGVDGDVLFSARDGSLGKAGASGKVLAALRTTEIAQLQIPSMRDKGLAFSTASGHIVCNTGVLTIDEFQLAERTHTITATGVIAFPSDAMDVTLRVQLLQGVRDIVGAIPLLDKLSEAGGIYLYFTGSPLDPKVSAARIRPLQELRQQGGGLINGVKGLLGR